VCACVCVRVYVCVCMCTYVREQFSERVCTITLRCACHTVFASTVSYRVTPRRSGRICHGRITSSTVYSSGFDRRPCLLSLCEWR
jgi:hypothetical protein